MDIPPNYTIASPSNQYLLSLNQQSMLVFLLNTDPSFGEGRVTPDMFNSMRRSRTRSIGNANAISPGQYPFGLPWTSSPPLGNASPFGFFRPLSAALNTNGILRSPVMIPPMSSARPSSALAQRPSRSPLALNSFVVSLYPLPQLEQAETEQEQNFQGAQAPGGRGTKITSSQWESHKDQIKKLFLTEDKSLEETMKIMEDDSSFRASKKQYNTKLKQWGFTKNIAGSTASWMVNKAKTRKRDGLGTEFIVGDQPWPMDRIEARAKRARLDGNEVGLHDMRTPPGVRYSTPENDLGASLHASSRTAISQAPVKWTPYYPQPSATQPSLRLQWNGKNKSDLDALLEQAQNSANLGNVVEAEDEYRQVLGGYEALLLPTHETTKAAAYELASFYARNNRMGDADKVLDWMGEKHIERWGIKHKKTREHLICVVDMLYDWSRPDDAVTILSRAAEEFELFSSSIHVDGEEDEDFARDEFQLPRINGTTLALHGDDDPVRMDYQVRLAITRMNAEETEAELILSKLLEQCEKSPTKLGVQIFEARVALAGFYKTLGDQRKSDEAMARIPPAFWHVFHSSVPRTELLFNRAIDMIKLLLDDKRYTDAEPLFRKLQNDATQTMGDYHETMISILIRIGLACQDAHQWKMARPRFEQALATSMAKYGVHNELSLGLQSGLDKKSYSIQLPKPEDIQRLGGPVSQKCRSLGQGIGCPSTAALMSLHAHLHH